ncbi:MAG TPA: PAS domain S-box protein [Thermoanaerobaculia bacterium]|jgi:PAS domain S-box-containing protein|nr:PAS domain S-box protein [Thermoanaerobaculia bacterium]
MNRYRALFENPVLGIRISSVADGGRIVESNPAYQKMLGYSAAELAERTIFDLTHPDDLDSNQRLYAEMAAGARSSYQIEKRFVRKDGSLFWGRLTAHPLLDASGRATHHIGLVEDVSESRRAQAALEASTERLQAVLNAALDGIVLINPAGIIQQVNPSIQRMFDYAPEELLGQNVKILMPAPWREEHDGYLARYRETGEARIIGIGRQVEGRRRDGSTFPLDLAVSEVRYGNEIFYLGTLRDITERVQLEAEVRQSQKMEAIGRLAGGVAHDFNTLLGTVLGYSEVLLTALPAKESLRHPVEQIHRAALRGAQLTRQLLVFSRRQEMQAQAVDLGKLLVDVDVMLDRLIGEDIRLTRDIEAQLGRVWGDPSELHQIILNLIVNACDAMPLGGSLSLALRNFVTDHEIAVEGGRLPAGTYVLLQVADTGMGMDEKVVKRIFEPFFTTKEPGKGTGLGLSTVHAIVRRSQGGIAVESAPGKGTTFQIYLPCAGAHPDVEHPVGPIEAAGAADVANGANGANATGTVKPGGTILLVEDDDMFLGLLRQVLEANGYTVLAAEHPAAALELVATQGHTVQLLLSDMVMPGGTGADLAIKLAELHPSMKAVLMSGYTDDALASREADLTIADAFLEKPFATKDLLRLLHGLLNA